MKHRLLQALALNVLISASGTTAVPSFVNSAKDMAVDAVKYSAAGYGELGSFIGNHKGGAAIGISATVYALYLLNKQERLEKIKQWMEETKKWAKENPKKAVAQVAVRAFILGLCFNKISILINDMKAIRLSIHELGSETTAASDMAKQLMREEFGARRAMINAFAETANSTTAAMTEQEIVQRINKVVKDHDYYIDTAKWRIAAVSKFEALCEWIKMAANDGLEKAAAVNGYQNAVENYKKALESFTSSVDETRKEFTELALERLAELKAQAAKAS